MDDGAAIAAVLVSWHRVSYKLRGSDADLELRLTTHRQANRRFTAQKWSEVLSDCLDVAASDLRNPVRIETWWPRVVADFREELSA